jgi:mono/diheme cytochrome c family protein
MSRVNIEITLGVLLVLLTGVFLIIYGIREEQRMEEFASHQQAQAIEVGAELFDNNCSGCHGKQGEGVLGLCPPLNDRYFFDDRIKDVGWSGSLEDYIVATVSSGRLNSTRPELYAGQGIPAMPAWSDHYGGPLRDDQIRSLAAYVVNWETTAPDRTQELPLAGPPVGTDITVELPEGDPVNGEVLAASKACTGCHVNTNTGPAWLPDGTTPGIGARAETRFSQSDYTGNATSAEQYLLESVIQPNVFVIEGYAEGIMPGTYSSTLTAQDAADLIAYMLSLR